MLRENASTVVGLVISENAAWHIECHDCGWEPPPHTQQITKARAIREIVVLYEDLGEWGPPGQYRDD